LAVGTWIKDAPVPAGRR